MNAYGGVWRYSYISLNYGIRGIRMVSFTTRLLEHCTATIGQEAKWASGQLWNLWIGDKHFDPSGN
jgi:hypothetical protein